MQIHHAFNSAIRIVEAVDADEQAANLSNWEQCYDQTTSGVFHGMLEEIQLPGLQIFRESTSQGMRQSCCVWKDSLWFGLPYSTQETRINGRSTPFDSVMVRPGGHEFELVTPADYTIFGVVVCNDLLERAALKQGYALDWDRLHRAEMIRPAVHLRKLCQHSINAALQPDVFYNLEISLGEAVLDSLLSMLDRSVIENEARQSQARRQRIVLKAREYLMAHHDEALTVPELCERLHVSRRTLQYCFQDLLGMSPMHYLRLLRLNGVRRDLRQQPDRTIADVATDWSFWHLSQFASDYRKLFGHCPSTGRQRMH